MGGSPIPESAVTDMGFGTVPDRRFSAPPSRVEDARKRAYGFALHRIRDTGGYFVADFGSATIMSSSMRAPGDESWLMHTVVEAGSQSPK
jgi:hypothetical protein